MVSELASWRDHRRAAFFVHVRESNEPEDDLSGGETGRCGDADGDDEVDRAMRT